MAYCLTFTCSYKYSKYHFCTKIIDNLHLIASLACDSKLVYEHWHNEAIRPSQFTLMNLHIDT